MPDDNQTPADGAVPDAVTREEMAASPLPPMRLGAPFAMANGMYFLEDEDGGCRAVVQCDCEQAFAIDLLSSPVKHCPNCNQAFTHALIITTVDDGEMVTDLIEQLMVSNGLMQEAPDDGDDDPDDEGSDDGDDGDDRDDEGGDGSTPK